jgi:Ca2+-binding RTX toxin-like protein
MARKVDSSGFEGIVPGKLGPLVIDASDAPDSLLLPKSLNLAGADYNRQGSDLVILDPDGDEAVIRDYFIGDPPPSLLSESGATFSGSLIDRLAGPQAPGQVAQAGATDSAAAPIGTVETIEGSVTITRLDGTIVEARAGDPVYQGDILETSADGVIGVLFVDETTFSLGTSGRMVLDEMIYDPETQSGSSSFSLVQGVFSFVSGQISKTGVDAMEIKTPVATIGIRGTAGSIDLPEGEQLTVVLTAEQDGSIGEITVFNSAGVQVLNSPFDATQVTGFNAPPSGTFTMTTSEFNDRFSSALRALPDPPSTNQQNGNQADGDNEDEEAGPPAPGEDGEGGDEDAASEEEAGPPIEGEGEVLDEELPPEGDPELEAEGEGPVEGEEGLGGDPEGDGETAGPPAPGSDDPLDGEVAGPDAPTDNPGNNQQQSFGPDIQTNDPDDVQAEEVFQVTGNNNAAFGNQNGGNFGLAGLGGFAGGNPLDQALDNNDGNDSDDDDPLSGGDFDAGGNNSGSSSNVFSGTAGNDVLTGSAGGDTLTGGAGDDTVYGGLGDDTIIGGTGLGNDYYDGGQGDDWVYYPSAISGITVDLANNEASGPEIESDTLIDIEHVLGGSGDDTLWGSTGNNSLLGNAGNDTLIGDEGSDFLDGGSGFDQAHYYYVSNGITADLASGTVTGGDSDNLVSVEGIYGSSYNDTLIGDSADNSFNGGSGHDSLVGGAGNDTLNGSGGNDTFSVGAGTDIVSGGSGSRDHLDLSEATSGVTFDLGDTSAQTVGGGLDTITLLVNDVEHLTGSDFDDTLSGSTLAGNDDNYIDGGDGNDHISAGNGTNNLHGGGGNDTIIGSANADTLNSGSGSNTLTGGSGNDSFVHAGGNDTIIDGSGNDTLALAAGSTISNMTVSGFDLVIDLQSGAQITLKDHYTNGGSLENLDYASLSKIYSILTGNTGNAGDNIIVGSTGTDIISDGGGDDLVYAGDGDDTVTAGSGNDTLDGGNGTDLLDYSFVSNDLTVDLSAGMATGYGSDVIANFENVNGTGYNDVLSGDASGNTLTGNQGSDTLTGNGGDDLLDGGDSSDTLSGGSGNDTLLGGNSGDVLSGGAGDDTLDGGAGTDMADYSSASAGVTVDLSTNMASGGDGNDSLSSIEQVTGSAYNDTLIAGSSNYLDGGGGDDLITAGLSGIDTLLGGAGNDTLSAGAGGDTLDGGAGDDTLIGGSGSDTYKYDAGDGNDTIDDSSGGGDHLVLDAATSFDNAARVGDNLVLTVNGGATIVIKDHYNGQPLETLDVGVLGTIYNILTGLTGSPSNELIVSGTSGDVIAGGSGSDLVFGGSGNDDISGANGNDRIYAGNGDDTVLGGSGNDTLSGGAGNDIIDGGGGGDIIYLGAGNDTLQYSAIGDIGDTIMDFNASEDTITFAASDFGGLVNGLLGNSHFVSSSILPSGLDGLSGTPTFIFYDNPTGNDELYYDEDGLDNGFTVTKVATFNGDAGALDENNINIVTGGA